MRHSKQTNADRSTHELGLKYAVIQRTFGDRRASEIKRAEIIAWLAKQAEERNWSPATQNRWQSAISLCFRVAIQEEALDKNPLSLAPRKLELDGRVRFLSYEEEDQLRKLILRRCPHNLESLEIAIHTGVRSGEQHSIQWWQVDLERRVLLIPKDRSKTKRGRYIQLNEVAFAAFSNLRNRWKSPKQDSPVFRNKHGEQLRGHRDWFDPILEEAALPDFTWHCLRHTFASRLVMAGVDLRTVGELMGHSSFQMTQRYAHLSDRHKEIAVSRLVPVLEQTGTTIGTSGSDVPLSAGNALY